MPASERLFSEIPPSQLHLDTDFLISALFTGQPHYQRSSGFLVRLLAHRPLQLVLSSIVWTETAHVLMRESFRSSLPAVIARRVSGREWQRSSTRASYLQHYLSELDGILAQFTWVEVPLDADVRRSAVELMARYALKSQDAVHLATAYAAGARDLVSFDAAFRRVDGLALWNDRVHRPVTAP